MEVGTSTYDDMACMTMVAVVARCPGARKNVSVLPRAHEA